MGVVKLCDFGFARLIGFGNDPCTEYVATRWYRAPELLVGEVHYGAPVDIWAIGCLFAEMMTGDPLFPGESDIDQLYLIIKMLGKPCSKHQSMMSKNSQLRGLIRAGGESGNIYKAFPTWSLFALDFLASCMKMDPQYRPTTEELLRHNYFTHDRFPQRFLPALREKVQTEFSNNPLLRRFRTEILMSTDKKDELKPRRSSQIEHAKWKLNLTEGSVKRKFSCDTVNSSEMNLTYSERSLISLEKSSQKLNVINSKSSQQNVLKQGSLVKSSKQSLSTPKLSQPFDQTEIQKLEKSLESLSRFGQKSDTGRPLTSEKEMKTGSPINPPSPPQFQSLQPSIIELHKSTQTSQNVLHPSINNISFGKEPPKKSPNILQSLNCSTLKNTFNQVPLLNPHRQTFLKKFERNTVYDGTYSGESLNNSQNFSNASWLQSVGSLQLKKKDVKPRGEFTLPNCPGGKISN